jgi:hypothetical protein
MSPIGPEDKYEVVIRAREAASVQRKSIRVLPADLSPGAREVSLLSATTKAQATAIAPMAEALESLRAKGPGIWRGGFLVAGDGDFDWRTAPWRRYESFEDFYDTELAPVFAAYEELVRHARAVRGDTAGGAR